MRPAVGVLTLWLALGSLRTTSAWQQQPARVLTSATKPHGGARRHARKPRAVVSASAATAPAAIEAPPLCAPRSTYLWEGRDRIAYTDTGGDGTPVVLIHGFGGSIDYWRAQATALEGAGYRVLALDLVGLGFSDKPALFSSDRRYGIELWGKLVEDFVTDRLGSKAGAPVYLCGNSFGSLVALQAAAREGESALNVKGICMVNCAVGMNNKNVAAYGVLDMAAWQRELFLAVLFIVDIVMNSPILTYGYASKVLGPDGESTIREALQSLYKVGPERVDDALVEGFLAPARTPGALLVLRKIYTGAPGPTPMGLWESAKVQKAEWPLKLIWGSDDALTPLDAGVGLYWQREKENGRVDLEVVPGGHIPHDDNPSGVNAALLAWLQATEEAA